MRGGGRPVSRSTERSPGHHARLRRGSRLAIDCRLLTPRTAHQDCCQTLVFLFPDLPICTFDSCLSACLASCVFDGYSHACLLSYLSFRLATLLVISFAISIYLALFFSRTLPTFHPHTRTFANPPSYTSLHQSLYDRPIIVPAGLRKAEALKQSIRRKTTSIVSRNELLEKKLMNPVVWTNAIGNSALSLALLLVLALSTAILSQYYWSHVVC